MAVYLETLADSARALLSSGGNLQSIEGEEQIDPVKLKAALAEHLGAVTRISPPEMDAAAAEINHFANAALARHAEGHALALTPMESASLEVIVQVLGRPALRYLDGRVQMPTTSLAENGHWEAILGIVRKKIDGASASVARLALELGGGTLKLLGTGWRIGEDLLVTNRHVAALMVQDSARPRDQWLIDPQLRCIADFAATDQPKRPQLYVVQSLEYCAAEDSIDAAILKLKPTADAFPAALPIAPGPPVVGADIYVVGHPVQRLASTASLQVFGDADGSKRCSPGRATAIDTQEALFEHDCSTLRGNSGSAVLDIWTHQVVGLHFGGQSAGDDESVGPTNAAIDFAQLGTHRLAQILRNGHL